MKVIKINNNLFIKISTYLNSKFILIIDDKHNFVLSYDSHDFLHDDNYIIAYSLKDDTTKLDGVYNIKLKKMVQFRNNELLKEIFYYMYLLKKGFKLSIVLNYINNKLDFENNIIDAMEFEQYLTSENTNIKKEEVIKFILDCYPELINYTKLTRNLTTEEYNNLLNKFWTTTLYFHKMPQMVEDIKTCNFDVLAIPYNRPYIVSKKEFERIKNDQNSEESNDVLDPKRLNINDERIKYDLNHRIYHFERSDDNSKKLILTKKKKSL